MNTRRRGAADARDGTVTAKDIGHCREAVRGAGHRPRADARGRQVRQARRVLRERQATSSPAPSGHLVEIQAPEEFDVKRGKWSFAHLPVIPPYFDLKPVEQDQDAAERGGQAGQAQGRDRPGQRVRRGARGRADLPPDRAVRRRRSKPLGKPVRRLWLQSMTPQAIRDGFDAAAQRQADARAWPTPRARAPRPTGWSASTARAR